MRVLRWTVGLLINGAFFYFNFFVFEGHIIFKLINVILYSALFILLRVMFGPTPADRIIAVDILGVLAIGLLALMGTFYNESFLLDIGLIWALLSFIASIAFAKILEGRQLDD